MTNGAIWRIRISLSLVFILAAAYTAAAGWVVEYDSGNTTYLTPAGLKDVSGEDGTVTLFDSQSRKLTMLRQDSKVYWQGSVKEFCGAMKQLLPQTGGGPAKPKVTISPDGMDTVAGTSVRKYRVMAAGQLHREVWVAETRDFAQAAELMDRFSGELRGCLPAMSIEEMVDGDPAYMKMASRGWVMREVNYMSGKAVNTTTVVSIREQDVPASEFKVPAGYRRVNSLMEMWM